MEIDPSEVETVCKNSTADAKDMLCKVSFPETTEIPEDFSEQVAEKLKDNLDASDDDIAVEDASTSEFLFYMSHLLFYLL